MLLLFKFRIIICKQYLPYYQWVLKWSLLKIKDEVLLLFKFRIIIHIHKMFYLFLVLLFYRLLTCLHWVLCMEGSSVFVWKSQIILKPQKWINILNKYWTLLFYRLGSDKTFLKNDGFKLVFRLVIFEMK